MRRARHIYRHLERARRALARIRAEMDAYGTTPERRRLAAATTHEDLVGAVSALKEAVTALYEEVRDHDHPASRGYPGGFG